MKTARETAHDILYGDVGCHWTEKGAGVVPHSFECDALAAAIEARDAEHGGIEQAVYDAMKQTLTAERDLARSQLETAVGALAAAIDDVAARAEQVWALPSPGALGIASGLRLRRDKLITALATIQQPQGATK
jgi:hypothetical protein